MNEEYIAHVIEVLDRKLAAEPEDNAESEGKVHEPANEADEPEGGCRSVRFEEGQRRGQNGAQVRSRQLQALHTKPINTITEINAP